MSLFRTLTATLPAAFVVGLACATPVFADTLEERLAVAKAYNDQALADMDMERIIEQMYMPLLDQVKAAQGVTISDEQIAQVHSLYMETFSAPMYKLMEDNVPIMAELMTLKELEALRDFYATDEGRAVMLKLPDLLAASQPAIMQMVQSKVPAIMGELGTILAPQ